MVAVDVSQVALDLAQSNSKRLLHNQERIRFIAGNWFDQLDGTRFDLIVSNPPYVAADDRHLGQGDVRPEFLA